jgi:hypothetical protein
MKGVCGGEYQNKRKEPRPNFKAGCLKIKKLQPRCSKIRENQSFCVAKTRTYLPCRPDCHSHQDFNRSESVKIRFIRV